MAKKKTTKPNDGKTQQKFTADGFPGPLPRPVVKAANEYLEAKRETAAWTSTRNEREDRLVEVMQEHNIPEMEIEGESKKIVIEDDIKAKVRPMKKDRADNGGE